MSDKSTESGSKEPAALIEVHVDRFPNPNHVTIRTNLVHVPAPVQNELQTILDCARLNLEAVDALTSFSGLFSDAHFHIEPAENRRLPLPKLKAESRRRILSWAFQDAMELVNQPLEQARRVLAVWWMKQRHEDGQKVRLDYEEGARTFHRLPLEQKLAFLKKTYDFEIQADAVAVILGLHKTRNCVVHRFGNVTAIDCDASGVLRASWEEYAVFASRDDDFAVARRVPFGDLVLEGERVQIRRVNKAREFRVGQTIELTGQDLGEICHTIHLFASQVRDDLRKKGEGLGISNDGKMDGPRLGKS